MSCIKIKIKKREGGARDLLGQGVIMLVAFLMAGGRGWHG